jgi:hypothetical protein
LKDGLKPLLQLFLAPGLALCPGKFLVIFNGVPIESGGFLEQFNLLITLHRYIGNWHSFILSIFAATCHYSAPRDARDRLV